MTRGLALALLLAGCATADRAPPEPIIRTVEVHVPVDDPACARGALERLGPAPAYPDNNAALRTAIGIFEQTKLLLAGRELRIAREAALAGALQVCGTTPAPALQPR